MIKKQNNKTKQNKTKQQKQKQTKQYVTAQKKKSCSTKWQTIKKLALTLHTKKDTQ